MKYIPIIAALVITSICICSCHGKKDKTNLNDDPAKMTVPDNSSATNPSMADTAYVNKDSLNKHDSLR